MKTILVILVWTAASIAQASEWTALIATEGAMVTIEKSAVPAPVPDGAPIGSAANHGTMALDIRVPETCSPDGPCQTGSCSRRTRESTPPVGNSHTQVTSSEACAGGVCSSALPAKERLGLQATKPSVGCNGQAYSNPAATRTRWRLFRR